MWTRCCWQKRLNYEFNILYSIEYPASVHSGLNDSFDIYVILGSDLFGSHFLIMACNLKFPWCIIVSHRFYWGTLKNTNQEKYVANKNQDNHSQATNNTDKTGE